MEEPKFEPVPEETAEAPAEPAALPAADEALIPEMPEEPAAPAEDPMVEVCDVQFRSGSKVYFFAPGELKIATGDEVILETARGPEFGQCVRGNHMVHPREVTPPLRPILRLATQQDKRVHAENCRREKRAMDVCQQKIADLGLEMQLVSAEYAFDGSKVLFFFTADGRVDFRELVKSLASVLRTRIELRQIGVRDKAKMVGGLGVCGRPFCCREFLDDFQPVSIKMAKTQNLSLNPTKISGVCGRLMCCLKYEQDAYEDLLRTAPKNESFVDTPDGRGTVTEVNLLRQSVKVRMEDHPETIGSYKNDEICVLRNGKARKNDPPIPKELAPISSRPRPAKKAVEELEAMPDVIFPDDVAVVERAPQKPAEPQADAAAEGEKAAGKNRRRRSRGRGAKPSEPGAEPVQEKAAPEAKPPQKQKAPQGDKPRQQPQRPKGERKPKPPQGDKPREPKAPAAQSAEKGEAPGAAGAQPHRRRRYRGHRGGGGAPQGGAPKAEG